MVCFLKEESQPCREIKVKPSLQWFWCIGEVELPYSL